MDGLKSPEVEVDMEVEDVEDISQGRLTKSSSFSSAMSKSQTKIMVPKLWKLTNDHLGKICSTF